VNESWDASVYVGECFVGRWRTKQNRPAMKPFFTLAKTPGNVRPVDIGQRNDGPGGPDHMGTVMIKALSAIAVAAFIAAALTVLPGFAPQVAASTPQPLAKSDRLDIHPVGKDCSQQAWPNFEASCLRSAGNKTVVREARLVTADRTP